MTHTSLTSLTIAEASQLLQRREVSPVELTEAYLAKIDEADHMLHAFAYINPHQALTQARRAADEIARGGWKGPLHGIPLGIKDVIVTADMPTSYGSEAFDDQSLRRDASVILLLREAGAVILGKNTTQTFGVEVPCASTRDPWASSRVARGSRDGSAVAVAAHECVASVGSDMGGGIRIPAAFYGVVGLRPTGGLVPRTGMLPAAASLDRLGPITRSVEDARILLAAMTGVDPADPARYRPDPANWGRGEPTPLHGAKIGVIRNWSNEADPAIRRALSAVEQVLKDNGATLVDVNSPIDDLTTSTYQAVALYELAAQHRESLRTKSHLYSPEVLEVIQAGRSVDERAYAEANAAYGCVLRAWRSLFIHHDLAACIAPTVPVTACTPGEPTKVCDAFAIPVSLADLPVVVQPMGLAEDLLPMSLQWIGRPYEEPRLLRFAQSYEQSTDWLATPPPFLR